MDKRHCWQKRNIYIYIYTKTLLSKSQQWALSKLVVQTKWDINLLVPEFCFTLIEFFSFLESKFFCHTC